MPSGSQAPPSGPRLRPPAFVEIAGPALVGLAGSVLVVATAGRLARRDGAVPPTTWLGLLQPMRFDRPSAMPAVMIAGVLLTVVAWWRCTVLAEQGRLTVRRVLGLALLWGLPVVLGPPILSLDVFSYAAHGTMLTDGLDPYRSAPETLGDAGPFVRAIDPVWRSARAPYGPLALAEFRLVAQVCGGNLTAMVVVLRALAALGVTGLAAGVLLAVPGHRRAEALALVALNPITLYQLVGAVHIEALMVGLLALGLAAAARGRPVLAVALLAAATAVKWPAILAVAAVVAWRAGRTSSGDARSRDAPATGTVVATGAAVVRDTGIAVLCLLGCCALVPDGLGWVRTAATPTAGETLYAPTTVVADLLGRFTGAFGGSVAPDDLLRFSRLAGAAAALVVVAWLLGTARSRGPAATAGWALLALAVLGPVLYPWYLTWALVGLAAAAGRRERVAARAVTVIGAFLALPHCELLFAATPATSSRLRAEAPLLAILGFVVGIAVVTVVTRGRSGSAGGPDEVGVSGTPLA